MVDINAQESEWLNKKLRRIGSSDARAIFGFGYDDEDVLTVWERLVTGKRKSFNAGQISLMNEGRVFESSIIELFKQKNPEWTIESGGFNLIVPEKYPRLCCTLDASGVKPATGERIVIEAKFEQHGNWADYADDQIPMKHYLQIQHQLICTGWKMGVLISLLRGTYVQRWVERNDELIEQMLITYADLIDKADRGIRPEVHGKTAYESVRSSADRFTARYVGRDLSATVKEAVRLQQQINEASKKLERHKQTIAKSSQGCTYLVLDDQQVVKLGKSLSVMSKLPSNVKVEA
ncbi:YqaJ viral recombinase family protein [Pirellulaceae bacterium SH501]